MQRRSFLIGAGGFLAAAPALAQTPPGDTTAPAAPAAPASPKVADPPMGPVQPGIVRVNLTTALGLVVLDLDSGKAPITSANFLKYADNKKFDATTIYRASHPPGVTDFGVVQGGYRGPVIYPAIKHEPTSQTGLTHTNGAISMGRTKPGTAMADWFVCVGDQLYLDAAKPGTTPAAGDDGLGYACFGYVVQGMDIIRQILAMPTGGKADVPSMQGQILTNPVKVITARRAPAA